MKKTVALKGGSYAIALTVLVLALLIVVNILAGALPASLTKLDISASKLYSITSNTKAVVNALEQDVTLYWIVQSGQEDAVIENLLSKYDSLSDHLHVEKKNPDVYPTFAQQYMEETVSNNSLVVVSGEKYRYVPYSDIYVTQGSHRDLRPGRGKHPDPDLLPPGRHHRPGPGQREDPLYPAKSPGGHPDRKLQRHPVGVSPFAAPAPDFLFAESGAFFGTASYRQKSRIETAKTVCVFADNVVYYGIE